MRQPTTATVPCVRIALVKVCPFFSLSFLPRSIFIFIFAVSDGEEEVDWFNEPSCKKFGSISVRLLRTLDS